MGGIAKSTNLELGLGTSQLGLSGIQFQHLQNLPASQGSPRASEIMS